jgi:hypothetical protein
MPSEALAKEGAISVSQKTDMIPKTSGILDRLDDYRPVARDEMYRLQKSFFGGGHLWSRPRSKFGTLVVGSTKLLQYQ